MVGAQGGQWVPNDSDVALNECMFLFSLIFYLDGDWDTVAGTLDRQMSLVGNIRSALMGLVSERSANRPVDN